MKRKRVPSYYRVYTSSGSRLVKRAEMKARSDGWRWMTDREYRLCCSSGESKRALAKKLGVRESVVAIIRRAR